MNERRVASALVATVSWQTLATSSVSLSRPSTSTVRALSSADSGQRLRSTLPAGVPTIVDQRLGDHVALDRHRPDQPVGQLGQRAG